MRFIQGGGGQNRCKLAWASLVAQTVRIHLQCRRSGFTPWVGKNPWENKWQPTPGFLSGEPQGQRSQAGYRVAETRLSNLGCTHEDNIVNHGLT